MALGIDRDTGGFTEVHVGRQFQQVGDGLVGYFRNVRLRCRLLGGSRLSESHRTDERGQSDQPWFHDDLPGHCLELMCRR